jgi:AraC family transcriptional regulator
VLGSSVVSRRGILTADDVANSLGFTPQRRITASGGGLSAAIWRFENQSVYELPGRANNDTDLIAMSIGGQHHHTYFADGRRKWSQPHPAFHMNFVVANEQPRAIFTSQRPFAYLHIYVPHSLVEQLAVEGGAIQADRTVTLIDPMCSPDPFAESIGRQFIREMTSGDGCSRMLIDVLGQQLVVRLLRQHSSVSGSNAFAGRRRPGYRDWRLRRAIDYLEAHLADDVSLGELAKVVGLSSARLVGVFREGTGEPPHRWLMNRRFIRACELLGNPSLSITEIAHRCGFASSQHLATVMRRRLAMTPTAYRRQLLA